MIAILDPLESRRGEAQRRSGMKRPVRFAAASRGSNVIKDEGVGHAGLLRRSRDLLSSVVIGMLARPDNRSKECIYVSRRQTEDRIEP